MTVYDTNGLQPFVADVAVQIATRFKLATIYGYRASATDMGGHPAGLAVDFVVGEDKAKGDQLAAYVQQAASGLRVKYVIWQQRIWYPGKSWTPMEHRSTAYGSDPNHMRHVHVSFTSEASKGDSAGTIPQGTTTTATAATVTQASWTDNLNPFAALVDGATWKRVGYVVGGAGLIVLGVVLLVSSSSATPAVLAAIPTPQTKAAGAALGGAQALTKG